MFELATINSTLSYLQLEVLNVTLRLCFTLSTTRFMINANGVILNWHTNESGTAAFSQVSEIKKCQ